MKKFYNLGLDRGIVCKGLTLNLIEDPFYAFASRADPDQAALVRAA